MKQLLIKLLRLKHLDNVIYRAMRKQEEMDSKTHKRELGRIHEQHSQQIALMKQSYEAKIRMLGNSIINWESRESEMVKREYKSNMQIRINMEVATSIMSETSKIQENVGRLQSLYDQISIQNHKLNKEIGHDI